jgi:hypothetical protein
VSAYKNGAQVMKRILAKMDSFQAKMDANQEMTARLEAKTDANLKEMKDEIRANNEKFEVLRDTLVAQMDDHHKRMRASVNASREETTACQEATEAYPEKWR